ncbi:MAG TPA: hypothetical protein VLM84_14105 [Chromatiaceae bacterium]|nr:hypothetical protein [Chromatiaceae bacterium]
MLPLHKRLFWRTSSGRLTAVAAVAGLPAYQVALWPDGWDLGEDGSVLVRDTHVMAEARRWYDLARRNGSRGNLSPVLAMHGLLIPPAILDLTRRRFPSEPVASVAVTLVAADWVKQRRAQLLRTAEAALAERASAWTGSRHGEGLNAEALACLVRDALQWCLIEDLIPRADYGVRIRNDDGWGLCRYRVCVAVAVETGARTRVAEILSLALIPWNRAAGSEAGPQPTIRVEVAGRP